MVSQGLSRDLGVRVQISSGEQSTPSSGGDVGKQEVFGRAFVVISVPEDHVGELVQNELLAMEDRVAVGVKYEVFALGDEPDRADAIVVAEIRKFHDSKCAIPVILNCPNEIVKGEGATQRKVCDGRRHGLLDIHDVTPVRGACAGGRPQRTGKGTAQVCVISSSRNLLIA
jgi:hypothetical protein